MASSARYKDLLDYSVSYKTIWLILGVAVAVTVAGWFAWQRFKPPGEDERARQVIKEAQRLANRGEGCVQESTPTNAEGAVCLIRRSRRPSFSLLLGNDAQYALPLLFYCFRLFRTSVNTRLRSESSRPQQQQPL